MKIGILGTRGIPNNYGGFEQFAQWLSKGLVDKGHEVWVYNSSNHPYQQNTWNGVHIIHCHDRENKLGTMGQFFYDLNCNKDANKRNFDVLFHFGYSSDAIWWRQWPRNTVNIINMDGLEWKRSKYNAITRKFLKRSEAWAARQGDKLVADSTGIKDYLFKEYGKTAVYIPYGAELFSAINPSILNRYNLEPGQYYLLVARMEPENNIDMIISGFLASGSNKPLCIVGSTENKYGRHLFQKYKDHSLLRFEGAIYEQDTLNNLRAFSAIYFHGHSVGGTNPSLLEAMACGSNIAAHDNVFNKAVLETNARYFSSPAELESIINKPLDPGTLASNLNANNEKIRTVYNPAKIVDAYEALILPQTL